MSYIGKIIRPLVVLSLVGSAFAGPALAATMSYGGSLTVNTTSTNYYNKDTKDDGRFTSGWAMNKSGTVGNIVNKKGPNTYVYGTLSATIYRVSSCVSQGGLLPMDCSIWS